MLYLKLLLLVLLIGSAGIAASQQAGDETPEPVAEVGDVPQPLEGDEPTDVEVICQQRGYFDAPECQTTRRRLRFECSDGTTRYGACLE